MAMHVAAAVFGISQYQDATLRRTHALKYAANDAVTFERYVRAAWSNASHLAVECWTDTDATSAKWSSTIDRIAGTNPDVFVVYAAGHGWRKAENSAVFCLSDTNGDDGTLGAPDFDRAFRRIGANTSILFLDCCHAEAVIAEAEFFHALENSAVRLFLCSSRAGQKAWEDDAVQHGLFSNAIVSGLAETSRLKSVDGYVDIEQLFGFVCDEVAMRAFAAKDRQRQEPVRGGLSSARMQLTTASVATLGRQISTNEVLVTAFRRWLAHALVLFLGTIAISDLSFQHLVVDVESNLVARSGLAVFEPLRRVLPGGIIDTGFDRDDLDIGDPPNSEIVSALENGRVLGSRLWRSTAWPAKLQPLLSVSRRQDLSILLHGNLVRDADGYNPEEPPIEQYIAWRALNVADSEREGGANELAYEVADVDLGCGLDVSNVVNFTHLNPTTERFLRELDWRLMTAGVEELRSSFEDAARLVGYRYVQLGGDSARESEYDSVREFERLADWAVSERYRGQAILGTAQEDSWCSLVDGFVGALTVGGDRGAGGQRALLALVETHNENACGNLVVGHARAGLGLLAVLARHVPLEETTIDGVSYVVRSDARGLRGTPAVVEWLATVAPRVAFPEETRNFLLRSLTDTGESDGYERIVAFNILARNAVHLDEVDLVRVIRWAEENRDDVGTHDPYVEGVSYLGSALPREFLFDYFSTVVARTDPRRAVPPPSESWRGDTVVAQTHVPEWRAIARVGAEELLPEEMIAGLLAFARVARRGAGREEALRAVAYQREDIRSRDWAALGRALAALSDDGDGRAVLAEAAGFRICGLVERDREVERAVVLGMWAEETIPMLRLGLGQALVHAEMCGMTR